MIQTFHKMREIFPLLNKRAITEEMVQRAAKALDTHIFYLPLNLDGYFVPRSVAPSGKQEIYINARLSPERQIAAAVHEIKHAAVDISSNAVLRSHHHGLTVSLRRDRDSLQAAEYGAYAMSAIALIPEPKLIKASRGLFDPEDEFLEDLWRIRVELQNLHGGEMK